MLTREIIINFQPNYCRFHPITRCATQLPSIWVPRYVCKQEKSKVHAYKAFKVQFFQKIEAYHIPQNFSKKLDQKLVFNWVGFLEGDSGSMLPPFFTQ